MRALIAVVVLGAALFFPEFYAAAWHGLHGNQVEWQGLRVPVPQGWYAVARGERMSVEKMIRQSLWQEPPAAEFLRMHFTKTFKFEYGIFEQEQSRLLESRGYRLEGERFLQIGELTGICWEYAKPEDSEAVWQACAFPSELISIDFVGARKFVPDFYRMIDGLRKPSNAGGASKP